MVLFQNRSNILYDVNLCMSRFTNNVLGLGLELLGIREQSQNKIHKWILLGLVLTAEARKLGLVVVNAWMVEQVLDTHAGTSLQLPHAFGRALRCLWESEQTLPCPISGYMQTCQNCEVGTHVLWYGHLLRIVQYTRIYPHHCVSVSPFELKFTT